MAQLSFIAPEALFLLLLLPLIWGLAFVGPRRLEPFRFWSSLALRTLALVGLVLAIAGAQLVWPVRNVTTIFLVDVSDSVAPAQRERALTFVEDALRQMPPGDQAGVVVFGENALVERIPDSLASVGRLTSAPVTTRTNIEDAVQLGLVLLPADTQKRLVLLSDGGENSGIAAEAARLARVRGVPLDVVPLVSERGPDVIVTALNAPGLAREGQESTVVVSVRSAIATTGRLQIFVDGQIASEQTVTITPGLNEFPVNVPTGDAGFRRLEARLEAEGDSTAQNNRAAAFTEVQGPPRLLLIANDPTRAANLRDALTAAAVQVDLRSPGNAPAALEQLSAYAGVVLVDTPARDLPRALIDALPDYVSRLGRGFAMVGGVDSFGAGGYRRTRVEDILPVSLDPLDTREQPDLALTMVVDRSGSMSERPPDAGGRSKLDLAKEAIYQASLGLSPQDKVGLVAFDFGADWILNLQPLPQPVDIEQALSRFDANGGTDIRPGLTLAADALANTNARIKHVILLTDGIADSNYSDLVDQLQAAGVTISTVAIGDDANPNLEDIAQRGGGRFYKVTRVDDVPRIFLQETVIVAGRDIVEQRVDPVLALPSPVVRGLGGLPPIFGYNGTELRPDGRAILVTPDNKPILAQRQVGLGRTVAWTSDFQGKWGREWVSWGEFARFAGGLADLLLPPRVSDQLNLQTVTRDGETALELTAQDSNGRPLNDLVPRGNVIDPDNRSRSVEFVQIAPGRYRALAPTSDSGVYLAQVAVSDAQGAAIGTATTGLVVSYSPEYSEQAARPDLLRELATLTGGRVEPLSDSVFLPTAQFVGSVSEIGLLLLWFALLLLPLDIAVRRLSLRRSEVLSGLQQRLRPRSATGANDPAMARLSAAKQRARVNSPANTSQRPASVEQRATLADVSGPTTTPARSAEPTPARATASSPPPGDPPSAPSDADTMSRLLAAKRRARTAKRDSADQQPEE